MSPLAFIGIIAVAIVLLVLLTVKFKIHPFMVLFLVAVLIGVTTGHDLVETITLIKDYFGSTLTGIGILIIFGAVIANGIRDTGAATSIANFFIKLFRGKRLELAPALTGFIMSIPVFGDIAIVLNAPIAAVLAKRKKISMSVMAPTLNVGLTLTHGLVPPTPGILAVTVLLGADIGTVMIWGIVCSIFSFALTWLIAKPILSRGDFIEPLAEFTEGIEPVEDGADIEHLLIKEEDIPSAFAAFTPLLLPAVMIAAGSLGKLFVDEGTVAWTILNTIGDAIVALFCGMVASMLMVIGHKSSVAKRAASAGYPEITEKSSYLSIVADNWITRALNVAMVPLMVTAMGGAMGGILRENEAINEIGAIVASSGFPKLLIPFILAAVLMAVCGSMTVAAMTAAALVQPMLGMIGLSPEVATLAIGAGSMIGWHVNNSGFWIFSSLYNFTPKQGLKYFTTTNALGGVMAFACLAVLYLTGILS
ncbi:SLC13 family permease [Actinomycetaceae bacterium L2_0104]